MSEENIWTLSGSGCLFCLAPRGQRTAARGRREKADLGQSAPQLPANINKESSNQVKRKFQLLFKIRQHRSALCRVKWGQPTHISGVMNTGHRVDTGERNEHNNRADKKVDIDNIFTKHFIKYLTIQNLISISSRIKTKVNDCPSWK